MKIFTLIIVAFFNMNSCSSEKASQVGKQYIEKITFQNWVGGVKGAGGGTILNIILLKSLPSNMELVKIHFQEREASITKLNDLSYQSSIRRFDNMDETVHMPTIKTGLKDNQAKIFFKIDGKENFLIIDDVKEIPMIMYPSAKPRNN
ncbi:hypothetical protein G6N05_12840 [Flavobacterium sp. F372]|jgi:hypothetical protein|uniref:Uncharacterized protein n=1 Tax=Flavobacterium bernardetii TaxID=2813823 RepID=A0ABR7J0S7_9FLAO|nr:hypothetical protein [Flavobacterium bernardetii]MBC5835635.1 hypothetical protein [Flavobacterium bernardetii]NHF70999.1 hypothetical protein [Flavobacterium bernardetii]